MASPVATFTSRSAAITSFQTPETKGPGRNLVLHFKNVDNYKSPSNQFFGANIGRVANRIYGGSIDIAGKPWPLEMKPEGETLHGGVLGWDKK